MSDNEQTTLSPCPWCRVAPLVERDLTGPIWIQVHHRTDCVLAPPVQPRIQYIPYTSADNWNSYTRVRADGVAPVVEEIAPADHLFIRLLQEYRVRYSEDVFRSWTLEEAKAVHRSFPGAVDRVAAESSRRVIDRIIDDVRAGRHRTWEDNTLNGNDATFATVPTPSQPAREAAREWMNTHHASFKTNKEREDALVEIILRHLPDGTEF